jgi:acyl carrier protein
VNSDLTKILCDDIHVDPKLLLAPETSLADAGVDSLAQVELSVLLDEKLGVTLGEADIARAATLGGLDRLVATELEKRCAR